jgi:hypothetical protein
MMVTDSLKKVKQIHFKFYIYKWSNMQVQYVIKLEPLIG